MLKKSLFAVALVAMLVGMTQAGEIKVHDWPSVTTYTPQTVTTIPVKMQVGYYLLIKDQEDLVINLTQDTIHRYSGCETMTVVSNFDAVISASVASTNEIRGDFEGVKLNGGGSSVNFPSGEDTVEVCVVFKNVKLQDADAKTTKTVGHVTIKVAPVSGQNAGGDIWDPLP
jgi:hypothetical protein